MGPDVNIKRSPLCARNFEYFSEDPYLTGEMAKSQINGVQTQRIGTSLKHYTVNNQEFRRMVIDAIVDNRALHEIYLTGYEIAIKDAQPWTVMCAYNRVKGTYAAEHPYLMTDILKDDKDTATSCLLSFRRRKTCSWVFGYGGVNNVCDDASLVCAAPGEYTVTLTVTGLGGNDTKTITGNILVGSYWMFIPVVLTRP